MATIRIPRLVGKTNASALTSWYWQPSASLRRKGWHPRALGTGGAIDAIPEAIATAARKLNEEVDGAAALRPAEVRRVQRPLTLGEAIRRFLDAGCPSVKRPGFTVEPATARQYGSKCRTLTTWGGDVALSSITPARVAKLRDGLMQPAADGRWTGAVRHHTAHETLRVGRTLFSWFESQGYVPRGSNPFAAFGLAQPGPRDQIWWQPHREALLELAAAADPALELAVDLAFSIGQREADLLRLQLNQYVEIPAFKMDPEVYAQLAEPDATGRACVMGIRIRQAKGKRWIEVPVVGDTRRRVETQARAARAAGVTCLLFDRASGLPWTMPNLDAGQRRFIRRIAELRAAAIQRATVGVDARAAGTCATDATLAAELEQLQFRDFRRTAVVYLGELGIADHLIAAITGHTLDETKKILETYMPRTTGMAARAIALAMSRSGTSSREEKEAVLAPR